MNRSSFALGAFFMCFLSNFAFGRGFTEEEFFQKTKGAAWFPNDSKPVNYCIKVSEDYCFSNSHVNNAIQEAVTIWKKYTEDKKLKPHHRSSLNYILVNNCASADLIFYFGFKIPDALVDDDHELSVFVREKYTKHQNWGKGYISVSHHTQTKEALTAILLHQIGHVLGNEHVPGTIMKKNIENLVTDPEIYKIPYLKAIDHQRELLSSLDVAGVVSDEGFKLLTGREARGRVSSTMSLNSYEQLEETDGLINGSLKVTNDEELFSFPFTLFLNNRIEGASFRIFFQAKQTHNNVGSIHYTWADSGARAIPGSIKLSSGNSAPIIWSRNMDSDYLGRSRNLIIVDIENHKSVSIFGSYLPGNQ